MSMFCYQCEQRRGMGCDAFGNCGKDPETAAWMDLLEYACKGISQYAHRARKLNARQPEIDAFVVRSLFMTMTNVNFGKERLREFLNQAQKTREHAMKLYKNACLESGAVPEQPEGPAQWKALPARNELLRQAEEFLISKRIATLGPEIAGLQELVKYGLKGMAAYIDHARILGVEDDAAYAFAHEVLDFLASDPADAQALLAMALRVGEMNLRAMELLDRAHTTAYGHPTPTQVLVTPKKGPCILVSGHDLKDLEQLLKQTENKGINIYTHGEMLPAHGYPALKRFKHLAGNYGGAWQDQWKEFSQFPGAILMTTNCLQPPQDDYKDRLFTTGLVGWPGARNIEGKDFGPVIEAALAAPGFKDDAPEKHILVGFARNAVLGVADKVIDAVKRGDIRHFFLIGGCDGARPGRDYYSEFADSVPQDCLILTLACGKYRFNKKDFGSINGIPRLLDVGQCNDAYSAVQIALALAKAFGCGVNGLPLSLVLSWYEQKAVAILLTLLHLGIKGIRIGPTLPAFIGPQTLQLLCKTFELKPITTPKEDLEAILHQEPAAA